MQTKLTQTGNLLDSNGCLTQVGWSPQPLLDCNLENALIVLPGLVGVARFFANRIYILSRHQMEQRANVSKHIQESISAASLIKAFTTEKREVERVKTEMRSAFQIGLEWVTVRAAADLVISLLGDAARLIVLVVEHTWSLCRIGLLDRYWRFSPIWVMHMDQHNTWHILISTCTKLWQPWHESAQSLISFRKNIRVLAYM